MAVWLSKISWGKSTYAVSGCADDVVVQRASYRFENAAANGDIIDLAVLPANHFLISARLINPAAITLAAVPVALLSGTPGTTVNDDGTARVYGATALWQATFPGTPDAALELPIQDYDQSLAVKLGAAVAAGGGPLILMLEYAQSRVALP